MSASTRRVGILDENRRGAFEDCLSKRRLFREDPGEGRIEEEYRAGCDELTRARNSFSEGQLDLCLEQAYFATDRVLRTLLLRSGYRATSFHGLLVGIDTLFVRKGRLEPSHLRRLRAGREGKDRIQEGFACTKMECCSVLETAEETVPLVKMLLDLLDAELRPEEDRKQDQVDL